MYKCLSICLALSLYCFIGYTQVGSNPQRSTEKLSRKEIKAKAKQAKLNYPEEKAMLWYGKAGARAIMPENTIEGMFRALDLGVEVLDMDVVITKDNQVVLASEPFMSSGHIRSPNGKDILFKDERKHNIYTMDYAKVQQYDVGSKHVSAFPGQEKFKTHIPLLKDVLQQVETYAKGKGLMKPTFSMEFRILPQGDKVFHPEPKVYAELVMEVIKQAGLENQVILQSFDVRILQYLKHVYPELKLSLMVDSKEEVEDHIKRLGFVPDIFSPYYVLIGKSLVDKCHELGMKVVPWTVNSVDKVNYFLTLGVDGIVTDYPNLRHQIN